MELIPVITLALVAVLLVLVIILLARKPVQPPKTTDSGAISALGALVTQNLREGREAQDSRLAAMDRSVSGQLDRFEKRLHGFSVETSQQLDGIRAAVDGNLRELREDNNKKLDEMRGIVDEKLQKTLSDRMNESFRLVNERLEQVYRGLGEMQTLAQGVGDLKKVLTNVKNRGIVGEIRLSREQDDDEHEQNGHEWPQRCRVCRTPAGGGRRRGLAADRLQVPGRHLRRAARCL